jgi:hypothetical protein
MQLEIVDAGDRVILPPAIRSRIRVAIFVVSSFFAAARTMALATNRTPDCNNRSSWPLACKSS